MKGNNNEEDDCNDNDKEKQGKTVDNNKSSSSSPSATEEEEDETGNQGQDDNAPQNESHYASKSSFIDDEKAPQDTSDGRGIVATTTTTTTAAPLPSSSVASGQFLSSSTTAHPHPSVASLTGGATALFQQEPGALQLPIASQIAMLSHLLPQAEAQTQQQTSNIETCTPLTGVLQQQHLPLAAAVQPVQAQPTTMPSSQQAYQLQFQMQLASQLALALSQPQTASAPSQPSLTALVQASQQRSLQPTNQTAQANTFLQQLINYQTFMQQQQHQYQPQPQEQTQLQLHQQYQQQPQSLQATNLSSPQDNQSQQLQRMMNENMLQVASSNFLSQAVQMQQQHHLNQLHHIQRQQAVPSRDATHNLGGHLQHHTVSSISSASASELASQGQLHVPNPNQSKERRWMMRYEELRLFQQRFGHCRVPHGYKDNRKLSWWVMNQRAQYQLLLQNKKSWLTEDRVALLNDIGFDWNPIIGKSNNR